MPPRASRKRKSTPAQTPAKGRTRRKRTKTNKKADASCSAPRRAADKVQAAIEILESEFKHVENPENPEHEILRSMIRRLCKYSIDIAFKAEKVNERLDSAQRDLQRKDDDLRRAQKEVKDMDQMKSKAIKTMKAAQKASERSQKRFESAQRDLQQKTDGLHRTQNELKDTKTALDKTRSTLNDAQKEIEMMRKSIISHIEMSEELTATQVELQDTRNQLAEQTQELEKIRKAFQTENDTLTKNMDSKDHHISEIQSELAKLRTENEGLKKSAKAEIAELRTENEELRSSVAELRTENEGLRSSVAELRTENEGLRSSVTQPTSPQAKSVNGIPETSFAEAQSSKQLKQIKDELAAEQKKTKTLKTIGRKAIKERARRVWQATLECLSDYKEVLPRDIFKNKKVSQTTGTLIKELKAAVQEVRARDVCDICEQVFASMTESENMRPTHNLSPHKDSTKLKSRQELIQEFSNMMNKHINRQTSSVLGQQMSDALDFGASQSPVGSPGSGKSPFTPLTEQTLGDYSDMFNRGSRLFDNIGV